MLKVGAVDVFQNVLLRNRLLTLYLGSGVQAPVITEKGLCHNPEG